MKNHYFKSDMIDFVHYRHTIYLALKIIIKYNPQFIHFMYHLLIEIIYYKTMDSIVLFLIAVYSSE